MVNLNAATVEKLQLPLLVSKKTEASVLRIDKIHETISGNKWFKLKYYLFEALKENYPGIVTFGGAYSNHILASACAAKMAGLESIGIIRGEEPKQLSHTLLQAKAFGMQIRFVNRECYLKKDTVGFLESLDINFSKYWRIPEGGAGSLGIRGASEILNYAGTGQYTHILCAVGTGTMFAGIINATAASQKIIGVSTLKGMAALSTQLQSLIRPERIGQWEIIHDYHFGGYAKKSPELFAFMNELYLQTGLPTDFVYTGKLLFGIHHMAANDFFPPGSRLLVIHSGGLQGNISLPAGTLCF